MMCIIWIFKDWNILYLINCILILVIISISYLKRNVNTHSTWFSRCFFLCTQSVLNLPKDAWITAAAHAPVQKPKNQRKIKENQANTNTLKDKPTKVNFRGRERGGGVALPGRILCLVYRVSQLSFLYLPNICCPYAGRSRGCVCRLVMTKLCCTDTQIQIFVVRYLRIARYR